MAKGKATKKQVEKFIEEFKACSGEQFEVARTFKTNRFLLKKNLTFVDIHYVVLNDLNYTHYIDGPDEERDSHYEEGEVWEFVIEKFNSKIYIKLKLFIDHLGMHRSKCMQFHD